MIKKDKLIEDKDQKNDFTEKKEDDFDKKSVKQTTCVQLNLFSWQTEQLAKGWRCIAGFNFIEAEEVFLTVLGQDTNNDEATLALKIVLYWKENFERCSEMGDLEKMQFIFEKWEKFSFPKTWGAKLFSNALLQEIISIAKRLNIFYINNNITIADLYLFAEKTEYAEQEMLNFLKTNERSASVLWHLANLQWILDKKLEAKQNYLKAILINPDEIQIEKTENKALAAIIKKYGTEMTPAWGWIHSQLPIIEFKENECGETTKRGLYAYYLLSMAETLDKQRNFKQIINYRKLLKENEPELYDAYFAILKKRKV
ncbi:MAG: hypothetical protein ABIJ97_16225 [Bacteroidota bacterium]